MCSALFFYNPMRLLKNSKSFAAASFLTEVFMGNLINIYLDNASTSYPKAVGLGKVTAEFIDGCGGNFGRNAAYDIENIVSEARKRVSELFHAPEYYVTVFTSGATSAINMLLRGLLVRGDHVVTSSMEHHAVMRTLFDLRNNAGIDFTAVRGDSEGNISAADIESAINDRTKLIIVTHASNVCGTILPIEEISDIAKKHNVYFAVDSAQTAGILDIKADTADFIAFAGHKGLMGPQGIGGFTAKCGLAERLRATVTGGTGSYSHLYTMPDSVPDKFEAGTLNLPGIAGINHSLKYISEKGIENICRHEEKMTEILLEGLKKLPVKLAGHKDTEGRVGVVSFAAPYSDNGVLSDRLTEMGVIHRYGLHCAAAAHETLGTLKTGTIRLSPGYFTAEDDIRQTLEILDFLI